MKPQLYFYSQWSWMTFEIKMVSNLAVAAFAGAEAIVETLLSRDTDVNTTDSLGNTPLSWAAQSGNDKIVELLLVHNRIDIDHRNWAGCTPLLLAAKAGSDKVVAILLEHGANPNLKDLEKNSPLWYAAEAGHAAVVELLLTQDLSDVDLGVNISCHRSATPLCVAVQNGHTEVVRMLLDRHDVDKHINYRALRCGSDDLLTQAVKLGDDEMAEFLYHGLDPIDNGAAETLLHCAAKVGSERMVRLLLSGHRIDPNCRSEDSKTPLMTAIEAGRGCEPVLLLLLDTDGIELSLRDENGRTALSVAAAIGNERAVDILLTRTAIDPNCKDDSGRTALSWAAEGLHEHIVEKLLDLGGVDPDNEDITGHTPLAYTYDNILAKIARKPANRESVVRHLLATGRVNVNARGYFGRTPIMLAAGAGDDAVVRLFLTHSETDLDAKDDDGRNIVMEAGLRGDWNLVELLLGTGRFDLNYRIPDGAKFGWSGDTLISIAMQHAPEETIKRLLSKSDIDVNAQDNQGLTLLALAVHHHHYSAMEQLLSMEGTDPNLKDKWGNAPLSAAICSWSDKPPDLLMKATNIDPEITDTNGRTPLSLAAEKGLVERVERLLSLPQVDPDSRDKSGRSPLSWAIYPSLALSTGHYPAAHGRKEVARHLLQTNRINVNAEDDEGWTPLGRAISDPRGDEILELLLAREDIDLRHIDKKGRTIVSIAMDRGEPLLTQQVCAMLGVSNDAGNSGKPAAMAVDDSLSNPPNVAQPRGKRSPSPGGREMTPERYQSGLKYLKRITRKYMTEARITLRIQNEGDGNDVEDGKLCTVCHAIDLTDSFSHRPRELSGRLIAKLGRLDENRLSSSCGFCKLMAVVRPRITANTDDNHGKEYELRAFSSTNIWLCQNSGYCHEKLPTNFIDTVFLAVVAVDNKEFPSTLKYKPSPCETVLRSGFIGRVGSNCNYHGRALTVRRVMDSGFDIGLIRSWIASCTEEHSTACSPLHTKEIPHLRLIRCATLEIVNPTSTFPPFTALSYVWGAVQDDQQDRTTLKDHDVEPVVQDAIRVTLSLGFEYLWVDRYCVTQKPGSIKDEQLRSMNLIYAGAEITLVAAAGEDASFGLPGVSLRTRRVTQPVVKVQGHILTTVPPEPSLEVKSSKWATRGWTYQEGLLSRRRLFFTQYEVSYECRELLSREAIKLPTRIWEKMKSVRYEQKPRLQGTSWLFPREGAVSLQEDGGRLFQRLAEYTPRQLTRQSDILNAMLGIFQFYASLRDPVHHLCGIPIMTQRPHHEEVDRTNLGGFCSGLCWRLLHRTKRRHGFPSWSWTGWRGIVVPDGLVHYCEGSHISSLGVAMDISIVEPDKGPLAWMEYAKLSTDEKQSRFLQFHLLQINAFVVQVRLREFHGKSDYWRAQVCVGGDVVEGYYELTKDDSDASAEGKEFRRRLLEEHWLGIVMGEGHILIVEEQKSKGYWERIGIATIYNLLHLPQGQSNNTLPIGSERRTILLG
jgi:ankyrin repeat protein